MARRITAGLEPLLSLGALGRMCVNRDYKTSAFLSGLACLPPVDPDRLIPVGFSSFDSLRRFR